jgi:hypothetical protein
MRKQNGMSGYTGIQQDLSHKKAPLIQKGE